MCDVFISAIFYSTILCSKRPTGLNRQNDCQNILLIPPYFLPIYADINNRTKKVDSREGLEAYDDERHQSKRDSSDSLSRKFFSEVFDEACKKEEQKNILIRTNGYTKAALPYYYNVNMREYR